MHVIGQSGVAQGPRAGAYVNDAQRLDGKAATVPRDNNISQMEEYRKSAEEEDRGIE